MADRTVLADGTTLDMLDPLSIRAYVRRTLALTVEPTAPQLRRLEMLEQHASALEAAKPKTDAKLRLIDPAAAAAELQRRLEQSSK